MSESIDWERLYAEAMESEPESRAAEEDSESESASAVLVGEIVDITDAPSLSAKSAADVEAKVVRSKPALPGMDGSVRRAVIPEDVAFAKRAATAARLFVVCERAPEDVSDDARTWTGAVDLAATARVIPCADIPGARLFGEAAVFTDMLAWVTGLDIKGTGEWRVFDGRVWVSHGASQIAVENRLDVYRAAYDAALDAVAGRIRELKEDYIATAIAGGASREDADALAEQKVVKPARRLFARAHKFRETLDTKPMVDRMIASVKRHRHMDSMSFDPVAGEAWGLAFVCGNGVLDLDETLRVFRAGDGWSVGLVAPRPEMMARWASDVLWVPGSYEGSLWQSFLEYVMPDADVRRYFQKLVGQMLAGRVTGKHVINLIGQGSTGKSQLLLGLGRVFGTYGADLDAKALVVTPGRERSSGDPRPELAELRGKRWVSSSEPSAAKSAVLDGAELKKMSGHDMVKYRRLYMDMADMPSWLPRYALCFASNHAVRMNVQDRPMVERLVPTALLSKFWERKAGVVLPEGGRWVDTDIAEAMLSGGELSALLDWVAAGFRLSLEEGMEAPAGVSEARERLVGMLSLSLEFVACGLEEGWLARLKDGESRGLALGVAEGHAAFRRWARREGRVPYGRKRFSDEVESVYSSVPSIARALGVGGDEKASLPRAEGRGYTFDAIRWGGSEGEVAGWYEELREMRGRGVDTAGAVPVWVAAWLPPEEEEEGAFEVG